MSDDSARAYRVTQLGPVRNGTQTNEPVADLDSLVTHHPKANRHTHMEDGVVVGAENVRPPRPPTRSHAFFGGEYQEVMETRVDKYGSLKPDQVLLIKDFILDDSAPQGRASREVDVPAPITGYVGRVEVKNGVVDIYDRKDGDVIARIRHLGPIAVKVGDQVAYGESLGTQNRIGLPANAGKHVHLEMDTRYYQQYENYIADLVSGRLPVQAECRAGVQPQTVVDDGVLRLGESGERVAAVQRALVADGYRGAGDKPIGNDGIYRANMQGALLAFQQDHRIPQTGDIDPATYQLALRVSIDKPLGPAQRQRDDLTRGVALDGVFRAIHDIDRGLDPRYTPKPGQPAPDSRSPADPAKTGRTPDYHAHPDHDPAPTMPAPNPGSPGRSHRTPDEPHHPDTPCSSRSATACALSTSSMVANSMDRASA